MCACVCVLCRDPLYSKLRQLRLDRTLSVRACFFFSFCLCRPRLRRVLQTSPRCRVRNAGFRRSGGCKAASGAHNCSRCRGQKPLGSCSVLDSSVMLFAQRCRIARHLPLANAPSCSESLRRAMQRRAKRFNSGQVALQVAE